MLVDEYNHSKNSPAYRKLLIKYKALKESNKELVRLLTNVFSASVAATNIPETEVADTEDEEEPPKHKKKSRRKKLRKNAQNNIVAEEEDVYEDPNNNVSALCDDLGELNIREEPEHKIEVEVDETTDVAVETEEPAEVEEEETEEFVEVEETPDAAVETEEPVEVEEPEEEAGVYEIEVNGVRYYTTSEQDGIVYAVLEDDDVGDEIGKFIKGKLVINK